ncbi:polysaccharide biosynthesis/export family protein [Candidatus Pelagibacter sp.]|jgi:polysaccharide biosynthesis/export protein|nr:polysaccharide biosynthesis/export family protein [Candidatus Pelagibacter sp.]|tara:strand:- start:1151 stop:2308 length:1158 start_codon:yes stop_codon:yes gene_type:complete
MKSINSLKFLLKISKIFFLIFFTYNCSSLWIPGINEDIENQKGSKKITGYYSIDDITIEIIDINKLNEKQINKYNVSKVKNLSQSIKEFSNIYNYKYEYSLGSSDVISINLTDTDDLDGSYIISPDGNIDLPFVGKINIEDLTLTETKEKLTSVLKKFYKNYDLQIKVEEFNSSKIYILGAVKNQLTINLNQKPIKLIDAAIQADYNPNSADKNYGNKGLLRRGNQVYKIDINNIFKSIDSKENFYLKKNDVLFVDRNSDALHIFGEVTKPGVYFPNIDYSLTELISTAGVDKLTANASKVYVIREDYSSFLKINVFKLDIRNPINLVLGKRFMLKPKDIVFIPPTDIVRWNRVISLLTPQTDLFSSYNPIIQEGMKSNSANTTP